MIGHYFILLIEILILGIFLSVAFLGLLFIIYILSEKKEKIDK